jgi:hypothetical protein
MISGARKVRVFVSYDLDHDGDLVTRLLEEAAEPSSGFEVTARSHAHSPADPTDHDLRRAICGAEQVIVLCGEHTEDSHRVAAELRIAQEEERPYVLLWGRRDPMCTRPVTARPTDPMYSWTPEILRNQLQTLRRLAEADERAAERRARKV